MDLSSLATHAQRLSARLSENIAERSKDLGLDPEYNISNPSNSISNKLPILAHAQGLLGNSFRYWERLSDLSSAEGEMETKKLLGSRSEADRVEGLKRVTVMMCRSRPVLSFFPFVTNCLHPSISSTLNGPYQPTSSDAFTIRHLVSIFILQHSHLSPDLALLSVNAWQKDLMDSSPVIRSLALKTLAGMGLDSVLPLVMVTIERLVNDPNWFVKRTVSEALIAVYNMEPATYRTKLIEGPLTRLLKDRSPLVIGAALTSWEAICPDRWDLLHKQFRSYCWILVDADENGQHVMMRVLTRYVREHFCNPNLATSSSSPPDRDLENFLNSVSVLFKSRNSSVVIAATNAFILLAPSNRLPSIVPDLIRLLEEKSSEQEDETLLVTLHHIFHIIKFTSTRPQSSHLFLNHINNFIVSSSDSLAVKMIKIKILSTFISFNNSSDQSKILSDLKFYTQDFDFEFVKQAIRMIGEMVLTTTGKIQREALESLIKLTKSNQNNKVCESIDVLRALLSSDSKTVETLLPHLQMLKSELIQLLVENKVTQDATRSTLYRLASELEFRSKDPSPSYIHFYKYSISNFVKEGLRSKFEILSLVSKSLLIISIRRQADERSIQSVLFDQRMVYQLGFEHLMRLARYDTDFSIRDRARYLLGLLASAPRLILEGSSGGLVEIPNPANEDQGDSVELLDEQTAFNRGHQVTSQLDSAYSTKHHSVKKLSLEELRKILFLDDLTDSTTKFKDCKGGGDFEANSLFRMLGLDSQGDVINSPTCWPYLDWNTIPAWTRIPLDSSSRDPVEEGSDIYHQPSFSSSSGGRNNHINSGLLAGNTTAGSRMTHQQSKDKQGVVLIPTDEYSDGRDSKPSVGGGHRNLEDFLKSSSDENDSEEEDHLTEQEDGDDDDDDEEDDDDDDDESEDESEEQDESKSKTGDGRFCH